MTWWIFSFFIHLRLTHKVHQHTWMAILRGLYLTWDFSHRLGGTPCPTDQYYARWRPLVWEWCSSAGSEPKPDCITEDTFFIITICRERGRHWAGETAYNSSLPSFGQHIKKPNYTQPHTWPGLAQLSVWEMYKTGCLCVHTGISGIRDKAAVHDHIKPLAGIVMPLLWCNPSIVCVCARVCVCSQASCLFVYFNVELFSFCRMHWSISHCNCVGISLYWISAWETLAL